MPLDMHTMSTVNVTVTAMLGIVLVFTWAREREGPFVGWWGLALLIQAGAVILAAASSTPDAGDLLAIGAAPLILGDAIKWKASRQFVGRRANLFWTLLGPVGFLLVAQLGYFQSFDHRLGPASPISGVYVFPPPPA